METKPLVTCHGDQSLFSQLHPTILTGLPKETIEWRRSFGRAPKMINLEASFVPFDSDILPDETDRTLISRPFFHIFWTACDLEAYKQSVREEITEWALALKSKNINDWLIVVVINEESKLKTKLLPRSSVIDKVRSDFCSKQHDRCLVLYEPFKGESKSVDSWRTLYQRIRQLLLQACTRTLGKYEENMRTFREKRNEPGWSFVDYFLVQEELAFMLEMMGVFEDALVQYDELDALFTQFVLNQSAGGTANWLSSFSQPCSNWSGLSLAKALDREKRDEVKRKQATLLDFRNYLFSRQCALLFLMDRPGEVTQRAMEYLHNTVQEMDILEILLPRGAVDCWVFLSALEILSQCEKFCDSSHITPYSIYTATLWNYARKKLKLLGVLCGLMPGIEEEPNSSQLTLVVDLLSGMKTSQDNDELRPMDKLREALSSKVSFQKHYLELSELAMGTFKHIGRLRSARLIGKDLADFYMKKGDAQKAESFLLDVLKMYKLEGWDILAENIRLDIAKCQEQLTNRHKLVRTACHIACCSLLPVETRCYYQKLLQQISEQLSDEPVYLKAHCGFIVKSVTVLNPTVVKGEQVEMELSIYSKFVEKIACDLVQVNVSVQPGEFKLDPVLESSLSGKHHRRHASRQDSTSSGHLEPMMTFHTVKSPFPSKIDIVAKVDMKDPAMASSGLMCPNSHMLLKRGDSGISTKTELVLGREECPNPLTCTNVTLTPGLNDLILTCQASEKGLYKISQLCLQINGLDFLKNPTVSQTFFQVVCDEPNVQITSSLSERLICGLEQAVILTLYTGSAHVPSNSSLTITGNTGLTFMSDDTKANRVDFTEPLEPQSDITFSATIFVPLPKPKNQSVEHKLLFEGTWLAEGKITSTLSFINPFNISHKLHTAKDKKFLQVLVCGETDCEFALCDPEMSAVDCKDVELVPLNKPGKTMKVTSVQQVSYLWQLKSNISQPPPIDFHFQFQYKSHQDVGQQSRQGVYNFTLNNYQTVYRLSCDVIPDENEKMCKVGTPCRFQLNLTTLTQLNHKGTQLMYEITTDSSIWLVEGKTTGIFCVDESPYQTELHATPLQAGYLPYPFVHLHLYKPPLDTDVWQKREDAECREDERSLNSTPEPMSVGQVYYSSIGKQVHVYPVTTQGELEINMV